MFEVGQIVVGKTANVCKIVGIEEKEFGVGLTTYYLLQPYFPTNTNSSTIFIPKEKAKNFFRELLSKETCLEAIENIKNKDKIWLTDPKSRRAKFDEIYKTGNIEDRLLLIKSIYLQSEFLKSNKKTLSMLDKEIFDKSKKGVFEELSICLDKDYKDVESFVISQII